MRRHSSVPSRRTVTSHFIQTTTQASSSRSRTLQNRARDGERRTMGKIKDYFIAQGIEAGDIPKAFVCVCAVTDARAVVVLVAVLRLSAVDV